MKTKILLAAIIASFFLLLNASAKEEKAKGVNGPIPFPQEYQSYSNYLSLDRVMNPDQVIRLFANDVAMKGPGDDGKLAYGSVIVAEVYKAKKDGEGNVVTSSLGRRIRGDLALIAVMQREKGWGEKYGPELNNEDWDFAAYKPDGSVAPKDINACRECHAPLKDTHHLFSIEHLAKAH